MLSHRNSYSVGSASAIYGFRSAAPTQPTRTSAAPIREGYSAEYEVPNTPSCASADFRHHGQYTL